MTALDAWDCPQTENELHTEQLFLIQYGKALKSDEPAAVNNYDTPKPLRDARYSCCTLAIRQGYHAEEHSLSLFISKVSMACVCMSDKVTRAYHYDP